MGQQACSELTCRATNHYIRLMLKLANEILNTSGEDAAERPIVQLRGEWPPAVKEERADDFCRLSPFPQKKAERMGCGTMRDVGRNKTRAAMTLRPRMAKMESLRLGLRFFLGLLFFLWRWLLFLRLPGRRFAARPGLRRRRSRMGRRWNRVDLALSFGFRLRRRAFHRPRRCGRLRRWPLRRVGWRRKLVVWRRWLMLRRRWWLVLRSRHWDRFLRRPDRLCGLVRRMRLLGRA